MDTRAKLNVSDSYIYRVATYSAAAYGAVSAAKSLYEVCDKKNPTGLLKSSGLLLLSLMPFLPDSPLTRYSQHIFKIIQNPLGWFTQQSLGLASNYIMQSAWVKLDPKIQKSRWAMEAAGVAQLGVDKGINRATQLVEARTDHAWQQVLWRTLGMVPRLTQEIASLEKKQAELDKKEAQAKNTFDEASNVMSDWKRKIAEKVDRWYGKGFYIIVEGEKILDKNQAIEHIAMKLNNGKKHRNIIFKNEFFGERHQTKIKFIDPDIAVKYNNSRDAYQEASMNASENRSQLATARAGEVVTALPNNVGLISPDQPATAFYEAEHDAGSSYTTTLHPEEGSLQNDTLQQSNVVNSPVQVDSAPAVVPTLPAAQPDVSLDSTSQDTTVLAGSAHSAVPSSAIILHPQAESLQNDTLHMLYLLQQSNVINSAAQSAPASAVTPVPSSISVTSSVQQKARAHLSLFSSNQRKPKNYPLLDETAIESLDAFKKIVTSYAMNSQKVKHGVYAGQLPNHLREILNTIRKIEMRECSVAEGMKNIIAEAKLLGEKHPLLKAANQCWGSITNHHYQRNARLG